MNVNVITTIRGRVLARLVIGSAAAQPIAAVRDDGHHACIAHPRCHDVAGGPENETEGPFHLIAHVFGTINPIFAKF